MARYDDVDQAIADALDKFGLAAYTDALMDTLDGLIELED